MVRNILGSVLALIGATAAVWSPFRAWYDGRHGRDFRLEDLFSSTGISTETGGLFGSLLLPFAFAALVTLVALVLRSRMLLVLAGVIVLGFTVLWMVRQAQAEGSLTVSSDSTGLDHGAGMALGGGVLLLIAAALMKSPTRRRARHAATRAAVQPAAQPGPVPQRDAVAYDDHGTYGPARPGHQGEEPTQEWQSPYTAGRQDYPDDQGTSPTVAGTASTELGAYDATSGRYEAASGQYEAAESRPTESSGVPTRISWGSSADTTQHTSRRGVRRRTHQHH